MENALAHLAGRIIPLLSILSLCKEIYNKRRRMEENEEDMLS